MPAEDAYYCCELLESDGGRDAGVSLVTFSSWSSFSSRPFSLESLLSCSVGALPLPAVVDAIFY